MGDIIIFNNNAGGNTI